MAGNKSKALPSFKSANEVARFFDSNDMGQYWDQLPKADFEIRLNRKVSGSSKSRATETSTKSTRNTGKPWTRPQLQQLRQLAKQNTPTRVIGLKLGRTENAVRAKANEKGVSLKPTNQSPYNRRKK